MLSKDDQAVARVAERLQSFDPRSPNFIKLRGDYLECVLEVAALESQRDQLAAEVEELKTLQWTAAVPGVEGWYWARWIGGKRDVLIERQGGDRDGLLRTIDGLPVLDDRFEKFAGSIPRARLTNPERGGEL